MGVIWRYPCIHLKVEVCKNIYWKIIKWNLRLSSGWWLNQPIWKICSSNWVHLPQFSGRKFQKIIELPPPSHGITYQLSNLVTSASSFIQKPPGHVSKLLHSSKKIHQVHGWFEAQKIPRIKVAICMNLHVKCHPEKWKFILEAEENSMKIGPSPKHPKTASSFSWEKKHVFLQEVLIIFFVELVVEPTHLKNML